MARKAAVRSSRSGPDARAFAARLTSVMAERQVSAADLVRQVRDLLPAGARFSVADLAQYRRGQTIPRPPHLRALSFALGVTATDLLEPGRQPTSGAGVALSWPGMATALPGPALTPLADHPPATTKPHHRRRTAGNRVSLETFGSSVRLRFDLRLPWPQGLRILRILKARDPLPRD